MEGALGAWAGLATRRLEALRQHDLENVARRDAFGDLFRGGELVEQEVVAATGAGR